MRRTLTRVDNLAGTGTPYNIGLDILDYIELVYNPISKLDGLDFASADQF